MIHFVPENDSRPILVKSSKYSFVVKTHMRKVIPRILGTVLLLISAIGILNAMEKFQLQNTYTQFLDAGTLMGCCLLFLVILTEPNLYHFIKTRGAAFPKKNYAVVLLLVLLLTLIVSLGTLNTKAERDLGKLFIANMALAIFFFLFAFNSTSMLNRFSNKILYSSVFFSGLLVQLFFLVLNFIPDTAAYLNPLSIILIGLTSLFMSCFLLLLFGKKLRIPLLTLTVLMCLFFGWVFNGSDGFRHFDLPLKETRIDRMPMELYMYQWILERKATILASKGQFPVVVVSSEGGGSRAGLWAFLVHSYLYERSEGHYFKNHLLSLTGASGGSVGNSMFFAEAQFAAMHRNENELSFIAKRDQNFKYKASTVYQNNYLSTSLLAFLGRDFFKVVTNLFQFKDRGALLEQQWSDAFDSTFSKGSRAPLLQKEFLTYYDIKERMVSDPTFMLPPLLLINATHTQTGNYTMISPVDFAHLEAFSGIDDFIGSLRDYDSSKSLALATAMRVNASFPYITPVGAVRTRDSTGRKITSQYADSGYYDNIGGTVTQGVVVVFEKVLRACFPELKDKVKLVNLLITHEKKEGVGKPQSQLLAPLTTLLNIRRGHTQERMQKLRDTIVMELQQTAIRHPALTKETMTSKMKDSLLTPVLPVGRYLSEIVIESMETRLEIVSPQLDAILNTPE